MIQDRNQIRELQGKLNDLGYGPLAIDGIYGRATAAAYQRYLDDTAAPEVIPDAPQPPKPWWLSRATIAAVAGVAVNLLGLSQYGLSAEVLTPQIMALIDVVLFIIAWYGRTKAQGPIDTGLVVPGVRVLDGRVRRVQQPPVPADRANETGFWDSERGPFGQ